MKMLLPSIFALLTCLPGSAQPDSWRLSGTVRDANGESLPGATLMLDDTAQAASNAAGQFDFRTPARPRWLKVHCIGYFPQRIALDTLHFVGQSGRIAVILQSNAVDLPEVGITAKPLEQIFEEDFSTDLIDYAFAGKDLVLLLRQGKKYFLRCTDDDGRLRSSLQLPEPVEYLHQSCTGDYHAVAGQWTWEFTLRDARIDTFPRYPSGQFHRLIEPCVLEQGGYYVFQKIGPFRQSVRYTYFDPEHQPHPLALIRDAVAEAQLLRRYRQILAAYMKTIPDIDRDDILDGNSPLADPMQALNPENLLKMAESNELIAEIGFFSQLAEDSVYAPLFKWGRQLVLLDHVNDRLIRFAFDPWTDQAGPLTYHHQPGWRKMVLVDAALQRVYGLFSGNGGVLMLREIDPETGGVRKTYSLTLAPYLSRAFRIRNGILYFIGQPDVNVPNRRLYKMNIFKFAN